jgi:predicted nucleic acid-binding protein
MHYLLDTNVLSEMRKSNANPNVVRWFRSIHIEQCYICVITLGEIRRGIEKRRLQDAHYAEILESWLVQLERQYAERLLAFDKAAADSWGRLAVSNPAHLIDAQIAAIALERDAILVTRNIKDFKDWGLRLLNPFDVVH